VKENVMLENVRKSHPQRKQPLLLDLSRDLPSPKDVQISYMKLRELCAPGEKFNSVFNCSFKMQLQSVEISF